MDKTDTRELMQIKKCTVVSRTGDVYLVNLKLINGRKSRYFFREGNDFITWNENNYHLSANDYKILRDEICNFDSRTAELLCEKDGVITAEFSSPDCILRIKQWDFLDDSHYFINYKALFEFNAHAEKTLIYKNYLNLYEIMKFMQDKYADAADDAAKQALCPNSQTLHSHPLYVAAKEANDRFIPDILEAMYGRFAEKDFILPDMPKEYDREYYVITDTIPIRKIHLSGYFVLHRPGMAMRHSTRSVCTINPFVKELVDAAKTDKPYITFAEFVKELGI